MAQVSKAQQVFHRLWNTKRTQHCQYIDTNGVRCTRAAIGSHTVQKGRTLSEISEDGHVLHITTPKNADIPGSRAFQKIGVKKASVFPGFCADHDAALFRQLEVGNDDLNSNDLVLLGYRSICHETFKKERAESVYSNEELRRALAAENPQVLVQAKAFLEGTRRALVDLRRQKARFEFNLHNEQSQDWYAQIFEFSHALPIAYSSAFAPEFTMDGKLILPKEYSDWNSVTTFCGYIKGRNIFGLFGIDDQAGHDLRAFFESLNAVPRKKAGSLALHIAIEHAENTFFRPSWIARLLPEIRNELLSRFATGVPGNPNSRKSALSTQFDIVRMNAENRVVFPKS